MSNTTIIPAVRPKQPRAKRGTIPTVDCWLARCPVCGDAIERFNGGTRYRHEPTGEVILVRRTTCECGTRLKINFR